MYRVSRKRFEELVEEGIDSIPRKFLDKLDNVAIVIQDDVTKEQGKKMGLGSRWTLFGLYEGVPQSSRGGHYTFVLPDKVTIFRRPILEEAESEEDVRKIVADTVWHEIAHHFGMDEREVRSAETRRKGRS